MVSNTFEANQALGVIITNSDYSKTQYDDLDEVKDNHDTIKWHFGDLKLDEIIEVKNSINALRECFRTL